MFPVHGGKCLSRKAVHSCVEKRATPFADDEEVEMEARKWLRQQSKLDKYINVGGGYIEK
jgi:hypothetical protein